MLDGIKSQNQNGLFGPTLQIKNTKLEILFGNTLKAVTIRLSRLLNHVNLNWFGFFTDKNSHGFDKARKYAQIRTKLRKNVNV